MSRIIAKRPHGGDGIPQQLRYAPRSDDVASHGVLDIDLIGECGEGNEKPGVMA